VDAKTRSRSGTLAVAGLDETPHDKKESCGVRSGESRDRAVVVSGRGRFSIRSSVVILEGFATQTARFSVPFSSSGERLALPLWSSCSCGDNAKVTFGRGGSVDWDARRGFTPGDVFCKDSRIGRWDFRHDLVDADADGGAVLGDAKIPGLGEELSRSQEGFP
jgi:hypothetical protein